MHRVRALMTVPVLVALCAFCVGQRTKSSPRDEDILAIQTLLADGNAAKAQRRLDELTRQYPNDSGLKNLRGVAAAQTGDPAEAERFFQAAISTNPRLFSAHMNLGHLYQSELARQPEAKEKALREYDAVLGYEARNTEANYQSAVLLMQMGRYRESSARLLRLGPEERQQAQVLAIALADAAAERRHAIADSEASQLIASGFMADDARQALPGLTRGQRFDLTVRLLKALEPKGSLPDDLLGALGNALMREGALDEAQSRFEALYSRRPDVVVTLLTLAEIARLRKDVKGELGYLAHARDLMPNDASIDYSFGVACLDLDLLGEAQKAFKKAVDLSPETAAYNYSMGMTTSYMHEPGEGIPYLQKYLQLRPADPKGLLALGITYVRAKEYDTALVWLKKASADASVAASAHYYLGTVATQQGRSKDAVRELDLAIQADPHYADALAELGQAHLSQKEYTEAEAAFVRALAVDPNHYSANFGLLTVYIRTKNAKRAEQAERFEAVQRAADQKKQEYMRVIEARPVSGDK